MADGLLQTLSMPAVWRAAHKVKIRWDFHKTNPAQTFWRNKVTRLSTFPYHVASFAFIFWQELFTKSPTNFDNVFSRRNLGKENKVVFNSLGSFEAVAISCKGRAGPKYQKICQLVTITMNIFNANSHLHIQNICSFSHFLKDSHHWYGNS